MIPAYERRSARRQRDPAPAHFAASSICPYREAMTEQTPAVRAEHPPQALLKAVNPLLRVLLRTPLAGSVRKHFMVLNFHGRKTGRPLSIPVSAHRIGGDVYAIANAPWKHNFRGGAPAEVVVDGKPTPMRGELITDRTETAELLRRCAEAYGPRRAQRMMGLKFRDTTVPTVEEFAEAIDRERLAAIRFTLS